MIMKLIQKAWSQRRSIQKLLNHRRVTRKIFRPPWKNVLDIIQNYWTQFKKFGPPENSSPYLVSQVGYRPAESCANTTYKNCLSLTFNLLSEYRLCAAAYENLYAAYKFIGTINVTQCSCERCFSKILHFFQLRLLKTRLRTSVTQNNSHLC